MNIKIDLFELSKDRLGDVSAGEYVDVSCCKELLYNSAKGKFCGCGCLGSSSIADNSNANFDGGLLTPCQ